MISFTLKSSISAKPRSLIGWFPLLAQNLPENVLELLPRAPYCSTVQVSAPPWKKNLFPPVAVLVKSNMCLVIGHSIGVNVQELATQ